MTTPLLVAVLWIFTLGIILVTGQSGWLIILTVWVGFLLVALAFFEGADRKDDDK